MTNSERRRADRHPVDFQGTLFLAGGGRVDVRIQNLGEMGALLLAGDLEHTVQEGDRAVLDHPLLDSEGERRTTAGSIVRVALEFEGDGVNRELAIYFDGGPAPEGYPAPESAPDDYADDSTPDDAK